MTAPTARRRGMAVILLAATGALGACSTSASSGLRVTDPRIVAALTSGTPSPVYLTITNPTATDDTLVSATSSVAGPVVLNNSLSANPKDGIDVPAHGSTVLGPFGSDLLLLGSTPRTGTTVTLTLDFAHAGHVTLSVPVVPVAAATGGDQS